MFLPVFVSLSASQQDNSKSYERIFLKFWGYVENGTNYQRFNFGRDPEGILDSGSLLNFRYHCVKGGIREPLAKRRWWRHLANNIALAEVPAGYDCFLVYTARFVYLKKCFHFTFERYDCRLVSEQPNGNSGPPPVKQKSRKATTDMQNVRRLYCHAVYVSDSGSLVYKIQHAFIVCFSRD